MVTEINEFKEKLIERLENAGGIYAPHLDIFQGKHLAKDKKFFAFKNKEGMSTYVGEMSEKILEDINCNYFIFNVAKVESIRDKDCFAELVRGIVFYTRIEEV